MISRKLLLALALFSCLSGAGSAFAGSTTTTTCNPATVVTTQVPYSVCNPTTTAVVTGSSACSYAGTYGAGSSDFNGNPACAQQAIQQIKPNCTTYYRAVSTTYPGACVTTTTTTTTTPTCQQSGSCSKGGESQGRG